MNTTETVTVSEPITLHCGQCGDGVYYMTAADTATCDTCTDKDDRHVGIARDIERYLEAGEYLIRVMLAPLTYIRTETTEDDLA